MLHTFFSSSFFENSILSYCLFIGIILFALIFKRILSKKISLLLFKAFKRVATDINPDRLLVLLLKPLDIFILLITFYIAFYQLNFPTKWQLAPDHHFGIRMVLLRTFQIAITISITWTILRIIDFLAIVLDLKSSLRGSKTDIQFVPFLKEAAKIIICIISLFFILGAIFNLNIASLIAGLGIGGLAIALAAKETLENLLGSFTIFLDKPFIVGDTVKVGNINGSVEKIGFRSTRLRTPDKTYLTVPNKKMVDAELDNLSLRTQRRVAFNIYLSYNTSPSQLKSIVNDIQHLIDNHSQITNEGRVKFIELGENSLTIMVLYFIDLIEEDIYLIIKEEINFKIMEIVNKHDSHFATKTIYLENKLI